MGPGGGGGRGLKGQSIFSPLPEVGRRDAQVTSTLLLAESKARGQGLAREVEAATQEPQPRCIPGGQCPHPTPAEATDRARSPGGLGAACCQNSGLSCSGGGGVSPLLFLVGMHKRTCSLRHILWGPPGPSLKPSAPRPLQLPLNAAAVYFTLKVIRVNKTAGVQVSHPKASAQIVAPKPGWQSTPPLVLRERGRMSSDPETSLCLFQ